MARFPCTQAGLPAPQLKQASAKTRTGPWVPVAPSRPHAAHPAEPAIWFAVLQARTIGLEMSTVSLLATT